MIEQLHQSRSVFSQCPTWSLVLLFVGACVGSVAVTAAYLFLGLVKVG
jgi:hypothetical protein